MQKKDGASRAPRRNGHDAHDHRTADETRARILRAARDLLASAADPEEVAVRAIAQAAGVSPALFYRYFPQRASLLAELAAEEEVAEQLSIDALLTTVTDPEDRIRARLNAHIDWVSGHPQYFSILWLGYDRPAIDRFDAETILSDPLFRALQPDVAALIAGRGLGRDAVDETLSVWEDMHAFLSLTLFVPDLPWPSHTSLRSSFLEFQMRALCSTSSFEGRVPADPLPAAPLPVTAEEDTGADGSARRARLVRVATEMLDESPYPESLTIRALADRADVSEGSVYLDFAGKEQILAAAATTRMGAFQTALWQALAAFPDPLDRLAHWLTWRIHWALEHPAAYRALWLAVKSTDHDSDTLQDLETGRLFADAAEVVTRAGVDGDPIARCTVLWLQPHGFISPAISMEDGGAAARVAPFVDFQLRGLLSPDVDRVPRKSPR